MEHVPISPRPDLPFEERIEVLEQSFSGRLGFHGVHLERGEEIGVREEELFPTASVIKIAVCCAVLDLVARGEASFEERLHLPPAGQRVAGGGILKQLEIETVSLRDAIELTITLSDNVATNVLIDRIGSDDVNTYLDGLGLEQTRLLGPVDFAVITHDLRGSIAESC
jgi:beta-lactamase class A